MDKAKDFEKGWEEYKAKKKQEIEEMEKDIVRSAGLDVHGKAKYLYDLGYRKIPENAVVLTREEYQWLTCCFGKFEEIMNDIKEQTRKETAEKFVKEVDEFFKPFDKKTPISLDLLITKIENIAKEFTEGKKCQE